MTLGDKISLTLDEIKTFLHIDHDAEDVILQRMLDAAANAAEQYLNHDFTRIDADTGETIEDPVPEDVELWILNRVARQYQRRGEGLRQENFEGHTQAWDAEEYRDLWPYRKLPGV